MAAVDAEAGRLIRTVSPTALATVYSVDVNTVPLTAIRKALAKGRLPPLISSLKTSRSSEPTTPADVSAGAAVSVGMSVPANFGTPETICSVLSPSANRSVCTVEVEGKLRKVSPVLSNLKRASVPER